MKRYVLLTLLALLISSITNAQQIDCVHLKNGSILKGIIIEQIIGESIKVQTDDGSIFVYKMSEVLKISKENSNVSQTTPVTYTTPSQTYTPAPITPDLSGRRMTWEVNELEEPYLVIGNVAISDETALAYLGQENFDAFKNAATSYYNLKFVDEIGWGCLGTALGFMIWGAIDDLQGSAATTVWTITGISAACSVIAFCCTIPRIKHRDTMNSIVNGYNSAAGLATLKVQPMLTPTTIGNTTNYAAGLSLCLKF